MLMGPISRKLLLCGFSASFWLSHHSLASEGNRSINTSVTDVKKQQKLSKKSSREAARLQFESALYPEALPGTPLNQMDAVFFDLQYSSQSTTRSGLNFASGTYTNLPSSFFYVNEAYLGAQILTNTRVDIGRKREYWAEFDNDWYLGLWEPRANWDPLRPFDQGLAGLFIHSEVENFELLFLVSPLFVPTVGPEIAEKNGSLISQSRWYRTPVSSGLVLDRETQLYYSLELPEIAQLAQQLTLATRLSYGLGKDGFWYSAAIARKPVNHLTIKYDYNLAVTSSFSQAEVRVSPNVSFHDLSTLEFGWQSDQDRVVVSLFADSVTSPTPINQLNNQGNPLTDWLQQSPSNASGGSIKLQTRRNIPGFLMPVDLSLSYLDVQVDPSVDRDSNNQVRGSLFPDRFNWSRAIQAQLQTETLLFRKPLVTKVRWMRELRQRGTLLSIQNSLSLNKKLALQLNADVLGVDDSSTENSDPGFFNQFRTNDRIYGGLSYAF